MEGGEFTPCLGEVSLSLLKLQLSQLELLLGVECAGLMAVQPVNATIGECCGERAR